MCLDLGPAREESRVVGRNRFIAPLGEIPCPGTKGSVWGGADWRNKAIAPYKGVGLAGAAWLRGCQIRDPLLSDCIFNRAALRSYAFLFGCSATLREFFAGDAASDVPSFGQDECGFHE